MSVIKDIKRQLNSITEINNLKEAGINPQIIENARSEVEITTKLIDKYGGSINSHSEASMGIGFISGILIYIFILDIAR